MPSPKIVVNEWNDSPTGHTNMSLYDANGVLIGTYGANVGDMDFNPLNGFEGGVYDETSRPGTPANTTTYNISQSQLNSLNTLIQQQVSQTASQTNGYYFAVGKNCVDQVDGWLDYIGVDHNLTSMYTGAILDAYATGKYYMVDIFDDVYSWVEDGFESTLQWFEEMAENFWDAVTSLFVSEDAEEANDNHQEAIDTTALSPIAVDLNGDGIQTSSFHESDVQFDLNGDGVVEKTAWLDANDGFLAMDLNKDGVINDISELFGGDERGEGYAKLQLLDSNSDGVISSEDEAYDDLLIWQDRNTNGVTDTGELTTLSESNIDKISVDYMSWDQYNNGNLIGEHSWATIDDSMTLVGDVYFMAELEAA